MVRQTARAIIMHGPDIAGDAACRSMPNDDADMSTVD
jgi:hypothetical protein